MKIIGINGSPRLSGNSAAMLESALAGARENGAEAERIDLFRLHYSGCISCFGCKLLGGESFGRCAQRDELTDVLDKVLAADAVILSTPLYFGETPGAVRNFLERLWFPAQQYAKNYASAYKRRIKVGLIYTMNLPSDAMYQDVIKRHQQNCMMLLGKTEVVLRWTPCSLTTIPSTPVNCSTGNPSASARRPCSPQNVPRHMKWASDWLQSKN